MFILFKNWFIFYSVFLFGGKKDSLFSLMYWLFMMMSRILCQKGG